MEGSLDLFVRYLYRVSSKGVYDCLGYIYIEMRDKDITDRLDSN